MLPVEARRLFCIFEVVDVQVLVGGCHGLVAGFVWSREMDTRRLLSMYGLSINANLVLRHMSTPVLVTMSLARL